MHLNYNAATTTYSDLTSYQELCLANYLTYKDSAASYLKNVKGISGVDEYVCILNQRRKSFPSGLLGRVIDWARDNDIEVTTSSSVKTLTPVDYTIPSWVRPHQRKAIDVMLRERRGCVESPTGSGKTVIAGIFLNYFPSAKVLVVVPSKKLLYQVSDALRGLINEPIGLLGDNKKKFERVTVAIINSAVSFLKSNELWFEDIDILLVDEAHHAEAKSYRTLSDACRNTAIRIGLSATFPRNSLLIEGVLGPKIIKILPEEVVSTGVILKPEYYTIPFRHADHVYEGARRQTYYDDQHQRKTRYVYSTANQKPDPQHVYDHAILNNVERNALIVEIAKRFYFSSYSHPGVILVERIQQGQMIQDLFAKEHLTIPFIHGNTPDDEQESVLKALVNHKQRLIISSRILNEGVDLPAIGFGLLALGGSGEKRVRQQLGRFIRSCAEKHRAVFVDIEDQEEFYLSSAFYRRSSAIKEDFPRCHRTVTLPELSELLDASVSI